MTSLPPNHLAEAYHAVMLSCRLLFLLGSLTKEFNVESNPCLNLLIFETTHQYAWEESSSLTVRKKVEFQKLKPAKPILTQQKFQKRQTVVVSVELEKAM